MNELVIIVLVIGFIFSAIAGRIAGGYRIDGFENAKYIDMFFMGAFHAWLVLGLPTDIGWTFCIVATLAGGLYTMGEAPGVGQPKGLAIQNKLGRTVPIATLNDLETWQHRSLTNHPYLSLFVRGLIWGAPWLTILTRLKLPKTGKNWIFVIVAGVVCGGLWILAPATFLFPIAWAVAMPLAMFLGHYAPDTTLFDLAGVDRAWPWSELLQPTIAGVILLAYGITP